eukprot:scaffold117568_cov66-Phaeocystis_antarctica.AAC.3
MFPRRRGRGDPSQSKVDEASPTPHSRSSGGAHRRTARPQQHTNAPEAVAELHRLRIEGDDLILVVVILDARHAKEKASGREHRGKEAIALELVLRANGAVVRGATQRCQRMRLPAVENRVIAGSERASVLAGHRLQDTHAAVEDVHLFSRTHHQSTVGSSRHLQIKRDELLWDVERHLLQPAAGLVGRLPPGPPLRAHR